MTRPLGSKRCRGCWQLLPMRQFHRMAANPDGHRPRCKVCTAAAHRNTAAPVAICERCQARQHGPLCLGPGAGCGCRCRPMLGLEGPFEFGDPTVPFIREAILDEND